MEPMTVGAEVKPLTEAVLGLRTTGEAAAARMTTTVSFIETPRREGFSAGL